MPRSQQPDCPRCRDTHGHKALTAGWHLGIAAIGVYEFHRSRSLLGRVLAAGLIAFHIDATIADATGQKTITRDLVDIVAGGTRARA